ARTEAAPTRGAGLHQDRGAHLLPTIRARSLPGRLHAPGLASACRGKGRLTKMSGSRGPEEFRADAKNKAKGATLIALNGQRLQQDCDASDAGGNAPSIKSAVAKINQLFAQVDTTRLDIGRPLLALRERADAGEAGPVEWWPFYAEHFTRSRKDA